MFDRAERQKDTTADDSRPTSVCENGVCSLDTSFRDRLRQQRKQKATDKSQSQHQ